MRLREGDGAVVVAFNVDAQEVLNIAFNCDVESCFLDIRDSLVDFILTWTCQDRIVSIKYINYVTAIKDAFVNFRLLETDCVDKMINKVLIPYSSGLFLAVYIAM